MRPECVVPEYQCAIKREAKRAIKDKDKPNSTTKDTSVMSPATPQMMIVEEKQPPTPVMINNNNNQNINQQQINNNNNWTPNGGTPEPRDGTRLLSQHQEDVIKKLVYYQDEYESPSEDDVKKIAVSFLLQIVSGLIH